MCVDVEQLYREKGDFSDGIVEMFDALAAAVAKSTALGVKWRSSRMSNSLVLFCCMSGDLSQVPAVTACPG